MHDRGYVAAPPSRASRPAPAVPAALLGACIGLGLIASAGCGQARLPGDGDDIDAGSGSGTPDARQPGPVDPRLASSFELLAELTYTGSTFPLPPEFLPRQHAFVLQIEGDGGTAGAIAGVAGTAVTGSFARLPGGELVLAGEIELPTTEGGFLCGLDRVVYEGMTLETLDDDGDGAPDRVRGTATGAVNSFGDLLEGNAFTAVLTGSRDITPPRLALVGPSANRSVLGDLVVQASEPLRPGLSVTAVSSSGVRVPLEPLPDDGSSIVSFVSPDGPLLPFGETVRLEVQPAVEDLAGNRGALETLTFQTIADPRDFPQDGFESQSNVTLSGGAALVAGVGSAPAIAGTTSLLLEPGGSATLRIPLQGGSTGSLTLQLRGLFPDEDARGLGGEVVLGSPDALAHVRSPFPGASGETVATGDAGWAFAGSVTRMDVPLPAGAAGELVVVLRMPAAACSNDQAPATSAAVLIDGVSLVGGVAQPASASPGS